MKRDNQNNKKYIIYQYYNEISGKSYIGQTVQSTNARAKYGGKGYKDSPKFWRAIQKYGWNTFKLIILKEVDSFEEADQLEQYYIQQYDTINNGYNIDGGGQVVHVVSQETVLKRERTKKLNKPFRKPYHLSEEVKKRQAESRRVSQKYWEGRAQAGLKLKGRKRSADVKLKISNKHVRNNHHPNSAAIQNSINVRSIEVEQYTKDSHQLLQTFKNSIEAAKYLFPDITDKKKIIYKASGIYAVCHNKKPSAHGYYWRFKI